MPLRISFRLFLFIALALTVIRPAWADCPAAPLASIDDLSISFMSTNNPGVRSGMALAANIKQGTLLFDSAANTLKVCDGTSWIEVGSGGAAAVGAAGYIQFSDGAGGLAYSGTTAGQQLFWDNTNKRLGIGTASPSSGLHVIKTTGGASSDWYDPANYAATIHQDQNTPQRYGLLVSDRWRSTENYVFAVDGRFTNGGGTVAEDIHNPYFIVRGDGNIGIGTASPNASAKVDITSTSQGFLPPRMTTAQRDAIASPLAGLVIFNTTTGKLNARENSAWVELVSRGAGLPFVFTCTNEQSDNDGNGDDPKCVAAALEIRVGGSGNNYAFLRCRRTSDSLAGSGAFGWWSTTQWQLWDGGSANPCIDGTATLMSLI